MSTYQPKSTDIQRAWHVVDADGVVLGRLASEVAQLLRGKHKPTYAPNVDGGDHVVVLNAAKVAVTGEKRGSKRYWRHSGYPGGIRNVTLDDMLRRHPDRVVRLAVRGMLPKNRLGRRMLKRLHVYEAGEHRHEAQQPQPHPLRAARRARA